MSVWQELGIAYLTLAGLGITFCLSSLALYGYRAVRTVVRYRRVRRFLSQRGSL